MRLWGCLTLEQAAMLTISDGRRGLGRREFLNIGGLALGGLSLPALLSLQASAATESTSLLSSLDPRGLAGASIAVRL